MRLLRIVGGVFFLILLLLCGPVMVSRVQARYDPLPELQRCNGLPCFLGIVPGDTAAEDVEPIIVGSSKFVMPNRSTWSAEKLSSPSYSIEWSQAYAIGYADNPDPKVADLTLLFEPNVPQINAASVLLKLGTPCAIVPRLRPGDVILVYARMYALFEVGHNPDGLVITPDVPARLISIDDGPQTCQHITCSSPACVPWQGFKKYRGS